MDKLVRRPRLAGLALVGAALWVAAALAPAVAGGAELTVFAAASLSTALEEFGRVWQGRTGRPIRFSFAASSVLARQIEHGAQADVFASADETWMDWLAERNLIVPETRVSALSNRLVLIVPADRPRTVELGPGLDVAALLGAKGRIATGDPAHVPVGRYAQEALTRLGLWAAAEPRLARAENARAALALVERGEAPLGIVYSTDAASSPGVRVAATFPLESHAPISYPFAIVRGRDRPEVRELMAFIVGPEARGPWTRFGFARAAP